jgi:Zn-finger nucleic acid-binding protein
MNCPRCTKPLALENYEDVEIDRCETCSGVWLDEGELVKIVQTRGQVISKELVQETFAAAFSGIPDHEVENIVKCPKCQTAMQPVNYDYSSGVILDRCTANHGVWLDKKELEKVQAHKEEWEKTADAMRPDWVNLVDSAEKDHRQFQENIKGNNMGPAKYVMSSFFRKLIGLS